MDGLKKSKKAAVFIAAAVLVIAMASANALAAIPLRLAGNTAADTAVEISKQTGWSGTAILASSETYGMSETLAAGPLAYYLKAPILLTENRTLLNGASKAELTRLRVSKVYVTSGTAAIPQSVLDEITAMGITVITLGGQNRAETSVNIAKLMPGVTKVAVANSVPDALSIASVAAAANQPILLVDKDHVSEAVTNYLADTGILSADIIGGTGIISEAVANKFPNAQRHYGYTAYDTNDRVIQTFVSQLSFDIIYVANGVTAIDALSGTPLAAITKSPFILTDGRTVPSATAFVFGQHGGNSRVTALGGTAVISASNYQGMEQGINTGIGQSETGGDSDAEDEELRVTDIN